MRIHWYTFGRGYLSISPIQLRIRYDTGTDTGTVLAVWSNVRYAKIRKGTVFQKRESSRIQILNGKLSRIVIVI